MQAEAVTHCVHVVSLSITLGFPQPHQVILGHWNLPPDSQVEQQCWQAAGDSSATPFETCFPHYTGGWAEGVGMGRRDLAKVTW